MPPRKTNDKTKKTKEHNPDLGRIPPQALDLEEAVLGALMLEKGAEIQVMDILRPESFYSDAHRHIFEAIRELSLNHLPIDILTVTDRLRKNGHLEEVGGPYYITQLTQRVGSAAHLEFHARIVAQKFIQRELIKVSSDIQARAFDDSTDVDDLLDYSERELFNIAYGNIKKESSAIGELVKMSIKLMEEAGKRPDGLSGVPSGFTELDRMTSGWQNSDLVIIAARPSMGKTAFILSMTRNMAILHKKAVAIFSLEMASVQLVNRLVAAETGLGSDKIRSGKLTHQEWIDLETSVQGLAESKVFIDDTPAISLFELRAKCRRLKTQHDIHLVVIDYLQLMSGPPESRGNREQEVSQISRGLKAIAKELNIPIMALSQLNRSVEMRTGQKRPQLSDLRESGAIEQDADIVLFIHRPEKYGIPELEDGTPSQGLAEIIVAKHRNGAIGDVRLRFRDELARFEDLDNSEFSPMSLDDSFNKQAVNNTPTVVGSKMNNDFDDNYYQNPFGNNTTFDKDSPF